MDDEIDYVLSIMDELTKELIKEGRLGEYLDLKHVHLFKDSYLSHRASHSSSVRSRLQFQ